EPVVPGRMPGRRGDRVRGEAEIGLDLRRTSGAGKHGRDGGVAKRKLQGRGLEWHVEGGTDARHHANPIEDLRLGWTVVEGRARDRAASENAGVVGAAQDDADPTRGTGRQQLRKSGLIDKRVAPGQQKAVEVS